MQRDKPKAKAKPGRKTGQTRSAVQSTGKIIDHVYSSEAMAGYVRIWHPAKRLSFRVDHNDRARLTTRIDHLIDAIADVHRIDRVAIRNRSVRDHDLIFAQQVTWFLLRNHWGLPYELITGYFDHHRTTILHGVRQCVQAYEIDPGFRDYIAMLPAIANVDIDGGRAIALQALQSGEVGKDTSEGVKMQPRALEGPNTGIVEEPDTDG